MDNNYLPESYTALSNSIFEMSDKEWAIIRDMIHFGLQHTNHHLKWIKC